MTDTAGETLRNLLEKPCEQCGATITRPPKISRGQWERRRFCSRTCLSRAMNEPRREPAAEALARRAERDATSGCLEWRGQVSTHGYGRLTWSGATRLAPRLAYETWVGPIPPGMQVCHHCDNRRCIEPTHLFLGTNADNTADRNAKGRQARGERGGRAKLTEADVRAIRASAAPHAELARQYGVGETAIHNIRTRKSWRHVVD